jgi:hypothetical protein
VGKINQMNGKDDTTAITPPTTTATTTTTTSANSDAANTMMIVVGGTETIHTKAMNHVITGAMTESWEEKVKKQSEAIHNNDHNKASRGLSSFLIKVKIILIFVLIYYYDFYCLFIYLFFFGMIREIMIHF